MPSDESAIPADVYYNILRRIKDLTFLWTTCRVVSRNFRDAVDLVFIRHHLPQTYLSVDPDSNLAFDGLDPTNPAIAIFRDKDCTSNLRPKLIRRLKDKYNKYGNVCHAPRIIVQVRRIANDTPVFDIKPNWNNLSLTANWKKTFSELFAEEKAYKLSMSRQLDAKKATLIAMRDDPEQDFGEMMDFLFATYETHDETARREVRDRRIKRHVWEQRHVVWKRTDPKGFKRVVAARNELGWLEFSDSEEEDEGRDEQDSEEEDGHDESDDEDERDEDSDDDSEEGEENEDDEEEEQDDDEASEGDSEDSDAGRRTKRRIEGRTTRARQSKSLPPDQSTGPSPAPTGFAFTFKAPAPSETGQ